jgi:hypothetical protein
LETDHKVIDVAHQSGFAPQPNLDDALEPVARQSGWEDSDNQDGHFGGRGMRMIVAAQR